MHYKITLTLKKTSNGMNKGYRANHAIYISVHATVCMDREMFNDLLITMGRPTFVPSRNTLYVVNRTERLER